MALCNALSSVQLAAAFPRSGGTYEFGRHMLGERWGFIAGWMFLVANTVGPGVSALAFGSYLNAVWPVIPVRVAAVGIAAVMIMLDATGIRRSVRVTSIIVILSIVSLLTVAVIGLPSAHLANFSPFAPGGISRRSAVLLGCFSLPSPDIAESRPWWKKCEIQNEPSRKLQ